MSERKRFDAYIIRYHGEGNRRTLVDATIERIRRNREDDSEVWANLEIKKDAHPYLQNDDVFHYTDVWVDCLKIEE